MERSGCAPPSTTILSARFLEPAGSCATSQAQSSSGSATVAESPIVFSPGASFLKPREPERKKIAALRHDERMKLVEDHRREPREEAPRVLRGDQKRHLLRRRQQDVGRIELLPLPFVDRRVAGARLEPDRQAHLGDRRFEVAVDVDGERLQGRDVERVRADQRARRASRSFARNRARERSTRLGRKPASVFPAPVGAMRSADFPASPSPEARSDAAAAPSRACANHAAKVSGRSGKASAGWTRAVMGTELEHSPARVEGAASGVSRNPDRTPHPEVRDAKRRASKDDQKACRPARRCFEAPLCGALSMMELSGLRRGAP